jgi:hypothetical protein
MHLSLLGECTGAFNYCGAFMAPEFAEKFVGQVQEIVT